MHKYLFILTFVVLTTPSIGQELDDLFKDSIPTTDYTTATFKTSRLCNGQTVESPAKQELLFLIMHRFGKINEGAYEFFGLDKATERIGLEYGITNDLCVGIGRSTYQKTFDGFVKYKLFKQSKGAKNMPVTVSYFGSIALNSLRWAKPSRTNYFASRLSYTNQILIAQKINRNLSVQLMPTIIHKNLVATKADQNDNFALGIGGRYKLTKRMSVNCEYEYLFPGQTATDYINTVSFGLDIETGGHVFQLVFTNAQPLFERGFITENTGQWNNGDIYFGFNISRIFSLGKKE